MLPNQSSVEQLQCYVWIRGHVRRWNDQFHHNSFELHLNFTEKLSQIIVGGCISISGAERGLAMIREFVETEGVDWIGSLTHQQEKQKPTNKETFTTIMANTTTTNTTTNITTTFLSMMTTKPRLVSCQTFVCTRALCERQTQKLSAPLPLDSSHALDATSAPVTPPPQSTPTPERRTRPL